ncbi:MAG: ATP synthase F0 subunit C [Lachnospiraceae bacterium]|nr:ATP synthase F0 subunit C [Lachnospiraceae bacterium]
MSAQAAADTTEAAAEAAADNTTGMKALAAALAIGIVGAAGAVSMGISIAKSNEGVARQPEAAGKIQTQLMLGLVFIETAIIYALIVAILIVFVM